MIPEAIHYCTVTYMTVILHIPVDHSTLENLHKRAVRENRTLEEQALWLIRTAMNPALGMEQYARIRAGRLQAAEPLFTELRQLYQAAGAPSSRNLSALSRQRTANPVSHTTVNQVIHGRNVPSWTTLHSIVTVLGGDPSRFWEIYSDLCIVLKEPY